MKLKPFKLAPGLIALAVIVFVCLLRWWRWDFLEKTELATYDMRARAALNFRPPIATNLGFVFINEDSLRQVWNGSLGYSYGQLWPRQVYGRLVEELSALGAKAVALDVIFKELRPDHPPVQMADGTTIDSDEFFARQMRRAGNVVVAFTKDAVPPGLFVTNAAALGDITTEKDADGVLRRVRVYQTYTNWCFAFRQVEANPDFGVDLSLARVEPGQIVLPRPGYEDIKVPLDRDGNIDLADFGGSQLPPGVARYQKPFTMKPLWHMGVQIAARELGLDLDQSEVDLARGRIVLHGAGGITRVISVDRNGYAYVDWCLPVKDPRLTREPIQDLLLQDRRRLEGKTNDLVNLWRGKLAVVGSSALIGNNLTDRGATPLLNDTLLVSKHWNVANSIIMGRFVQRSSLATDLLLILALGIITAVLTWELRVLVASSLVLLLVAGYIGLATALYVRTRYWLPLTLPILGAILMNHVCLVTWRVVFEQAERRRTRNILSTMVSPKIVPILLKSERLSLDGVRREITVLFADVRGFTEFTDTSQERVEEFVRQKNLTGADAEACVDQAARETIATINLYLGVVADTVLDHEGTLDKFIGDCVMAFWGAPEPQHNHAAACVRAAIAAQRAVHELNLRRAAENKSLEAENLARASAGLPAKTLLPLLVLGTGINSGTAIAGLMGSEVKTVVRQANYTVFGREVNLASRLEGLSGRGRIFISEATYQHLQHDDPALAATCMLQPPAKVKGIAAAVKVYEVPWLPAADSATLVGVPPHASSTTLPTEIA